MTETELLADLDRVLAATEAVVAGIRAAYQRAAAQLREAPGGSAGRCDEG